MGTDTKRHGGQVRKRLSYRQKVLSVFPKAYLTQTKEVIQWVGNTDSFKGYIWYDNLSSQPNDPPNIKNWGGFRRGMLKKRGDERG